MLLTHYFGTLGLPYGWAWTLSQVLVLGVLEFLMLLMVAAVILLDRKIWAAVQLRRGPDGVL